MKRKTLVRCALLLAMLVVGARADAASDGKYWIFFTDKGPHRPPQGTLMSGSAEEREARALLSVRALERRAKVLPSAELVTAADLPVYPGYRSRVAKLGARIANEVRWMNAVSALLTDAQREAVLLLPFVERIEPVRRVRMSPPPSADAAAPPPAMKTTSLDYGNSKDQNLMINVPLLHDFGINGKGAIVGMLDTGFRWKLHEALETCDVLGEYDVINGDSVTENQAGDALSQDTHGTYTFSTIAGYMPGKLIGPAYGASYLLAKTEYYPAEYQVEEDYWAAGIEWLESRGADVASSSLGYNTFDDGPGYSWASGDFNGRTSVTALAALRAARLGVTVCDAMGNEGNGDGVTGTMLTPADADSIISVGAVSFLRYLSTISSTGPTNDGRFKPDVVAPGVGVYCARPGIATYTSATGTSMATPLAAGAAALMLSARPELTPIQVRNALRATADSIDSQYFPVRPNNFTGWGLVNAFNAVLSFGPVFSNRPTIGLAGSMSTVSIGVVSRFGITPGSVMLNYTVGPGGPEYSIPMTLDSAMVFPTSGRYIAVIPPQSPGTLVQFTIEASDDSGHTYASPAPVKGGAWVLRYGTTDVGSVPNLPATTELLQNYPNPFNPETRFTYRLSASGFVTCTIVDLLGRTVATVVNEQQPAGEYTVSWNGAGQPSGVYFYRLSAGKSVLTRKMLLLR